MTTNILRYNYTTTVRERYDLTKEEAFALILYEQNEAQRKKHAIILTSKDNDEKSSFKADSSETLSHNYTWIHFCPQEILNFDDETEQKDKYFVLVMENVETK